MVHSAATLDAVRAGVAERSRDGLWPGGTSCGTDGGRAWRPTATAVLQRSHREAGVLLDESVWPPLVTLVSSLNDCTDWPSSAARARDLTPLALATVGSAQWSGDAKVAAVSWVALSALEHSVPLLFCAVADLYSDAAAHATALRRWAAVLQDGKHMQQAARSAFLAAKALADATDAWDTPRDAARAVRYGEDACTSALAFTLASQDGDARQAFLNVGAMHGKARRAMESHEDVRQKLLVQRHNDALAGVHAGWRKNAIVTPPEKQA